MSGLIIFCIAYLGIALGKVPGLKIDRVGVALLGAICMVVFGVLTPQKAFQSIDLPTILLLYSLMIISAQLRLGGFYTWVARAIVPLCKRPDLFLLVVMLISAVLSSLLANDIVCFAFTPVLALALLSARRNPIPYLLGLAVASNIGSAATIIGNPQNMLIGQTGKLDFMDFVLWCAPPSMLALLLSYLIILVLRRYLVAPEMVVEPVSGEPQTREFDAWQTSKGLAAVVLLVVLFLTPLPREISALGIAGMLLCSRRMKSREIMGLVDWHLITLFCALFVIIHGVSQGGYLDLTPMRLAGWGVDLASFPTLAAVSTVLSNVFSNVPAVMLLIGSLDPQQPLQWYVLALSSTFAGNLFLLGSIANLIVVEQALQCGVRISFARHALLGVPVTLVSLGVMLAWLAIFQGWGLP